MTQEWASGVGLTRQELELEMSEGKRAVQRLVRSNIRLVLSIAKKYRSEFVDYSDLIQVRC
jgi:RNA polymerase nonessential primary-like sigma factor